MKFHGSGIGKLRTRVLVYDPCCRLGKTTGGSSCTEQWGGDPIIRLHREQAPGAQTANVRRSSNEHRCLSRIPYIPRAIRKQLPIAPCLIDIHSEHRHVSDSIPDCGAHSRFYQPSYPAARLVSFHISEVPVIKRLEIRQPLCTVYS